MVEDVDKFIGKSNMSIVEALEKIDGNSCGVLFIVDENDCLTGALSDGDVRRWLIKTGDLQGKVTSAMNKKPISLKDDEEINAFNVMKKNKLTAIPIVDSDLKVIRVINSRIEDVSITKDNVSLKAVPVVMMAGGKGTRLYPYTKILPKPLIPVGEKPIAEHIIESFREFGCEQYYLIVNHKKNMIKAYFNEMKKDYTVTYADEDEPLGTGGGLSLLKGIIKDTFILTNCDILIREDFSKVYKFHKENRNQITMVCSLKNFRIPYGIVHLADGGSIKNIEEKPTLSFFTNTGCYIVEPEVITDIPDNTAIGFPDIIEQYRNQGKKVGVYPVSEGSWMDMGQMDSLEDMRMRLEVK